MMYMVCTQGIHSFFIWYKSDYIIYLIFFSLLGLLIFFYDCSRFVLCLSISVSLSLSLSDFESNPCTGCSPFGLVALDRAATLHDVLENAQFLGVVAPARPEMALRRRLILRDGLRAETWPHIIRLMLVKVFLGCFSWRGFWEGPAGHILLARGQCRVFRCVPARSNGGWRARLVLKTALAPSVPKRVLGRLAQLGLALGVVLGAWVLLQIVRLHLQKRKRQLQIGAHDQR